MMDIIGNFHDYHNYCVKGVQSIHSQTSCILSHLNLPVLVKVGVGGQGRRQSRRASLPADLTLILLLTLPDEVGDGAGVEDVLAVQLHMTSARDRS